MLSHTFSFEHSECSLWVTTASALLFRSVGAEQDIPTRSADDQTPSSQQVTLSVTWCGWVSGRDPSSRQEITLSDGGAVHDRSSNGIVFLNCVVTGGRKRMLLGLS